jgi:hypothetical protein
VLSKLPDDHIWNKILFQEALCAFVLNLCNCIACQEQKRFMKMQLGLSSGQMTTTFLSRIQQLNRYLPYLLGTVNKFYAGDVSKMFFYALPTYI